MNPEEIAQMQQGMAPEQPGEMAQPAPMQPEVGQMTTPEQEQELANLLQAAQSEMANLTSQRFSSENERKQYKLDVLSAVFEMLQSSGVDLNSPESVAQFLQELKARNPQMATDFEVAIEALLGEEAGETVEGAMDGGIEPEEMNETNETLPQELPGSIPTGFPPR